MFDENQRHGQGTMTFIDTHPYHTQTCDWIKNNCTEGTLTRHDGTAYTGPIKNGWAFGSGTVTYPDGSVYTGAMQKGMRHGKGEIVYADGSKYAGKWRRDEKKEKKEKAVKGEEDL
jgi:hypothetical protein